MNSRQDSRLTGEEGVLRSDLAEVIDRAAAMAVYAYASVHRAGKAEGQRLPPQLAEHLAEATYVDVLRYSLDECTCPCHQDH